MPETFVFKDGKADEVLSIQANGQAVIGGKHRVVEFTDAAFYVVGADAMRVVLDAKVAEQECPACGGDATVTVTKFSEEPSVVDSTPRKTECRGREATPPSHNRGRTWRASALWFLCRASAAERERCRFKPLDRERACPAVTDADLKLYEALNNYVGREKWWSEKEMSLIIARHRAAERAELERLLTEKDQYLQAFELSERNYNTLQADLTALRAKLAAAEERCKDLSHDVSVYRNRIADAGGVLVGLLAVKGAPAPAAERSK